MKLFDCYILAGKKGLSICLSSPPLTHSHALSHVHVQEEELIPFQDIQYITGAPYPGCMSWHIHPFRKKPRVWQKIKSFADKLENTDENSKELVKALVWLCKGCILAYALSIIQYYSLVHSNQRIHKRNIKSILPSFCRHLSPIQFFPFFLATPSVSFLCFHSINAWTSFTRWIFFGSPINK